MDAQNLQILFLYCKQAKPVASKVGLPFICTDEIKNAYTAAFIKM